MLGSSPSSIVRRFGRAPIQSRLRARVVLVSGPSDVDGGRLWSDIGPWSCVVRRVRRSVLVSPLPLAHRNGGIGCGSRRFGRRARLRLAPLPVVPTHSRGSDGIRGYTVCVLWQGVTSSFPWLVHTATYLVVKGTVCECNRSRGTNLTSEPNARATAP